jgi:hypothetical protein
MSAARLQRDIHDLERRIGEVLSQSARTGTMANAAGSPLGEALHALHECRQALVYCSLNDDGRRAAPPTAVHASPDPNEGAAAA